MIPCLIERVDMAERYDLPSQTGVPIVIEDKQSLEVLRSVDPNFSGLIKTDEDF